MKVSLVLLTIFLLSACHKDDQGKHSPFIITSNSAVPATNISITLRSDTFIIPTRADQDVKIFINDKEIDSPWIWKIASNKVG